MNVASGRPPRYTNPSVMGTAMTATMTRRPSSDTMVSRFYARCDERRAAGIDSDFHDLGFFRLHEILDARHVVIVQLLQILLGVLDVIFAHAVQFLEARACLRSVMTHGHAAFFRELVDDLHEVFAP